MVEPKLHHGKLQDDDSNYCTDTIGIADARMFSNEVEDFLPLLKKRHYEQYRQKREADVANSYEDVYNWHFLATPSKKDNYIIHCKYFYVKWVIFYEYAKIDAEIY